MRICPLCIVGSGILLASVGLIGIAPMVGAGERPAPLAADGYAVDGTHSFVNFRVKHNNVAYAYGRFDKVSGSFNFEEGKPESGSLDITVDTASISSGNGKRDDHLKSQDFFSVKEFPTASFKSTGMKKDGENLIATGDFTMHGVTKSITVPIDVVGFGEGRGGAKIAGFEAKVTVKRSDYGMTFMQGPLGDEVTIIVSCEGTKK
jgi:polyisoprenoid-binding protein YceI